MNLMNQLKGKINLAKLGRIMAVCLAGVLLVMTTACSNSPTPKASDAGSYEGRQAKQTDIYGTTQDRVDNMNNYRDTPANLDTSAADAKADRLIRRAKQNLNKVNDREDFVESFQEGRPLNERISNVTDRVGDGVENAAEGLSDTARKGFRNVQKNSRNAADDLSRATDRTVDRAGDRLSDTARDVSKSVERTARDASRG
jgi:uncharacterized membrane protein